jgi:L-ascorbate metabolism protein UlaG (beta-lactamase superfamily)
MTATLTWLGQSGFILGASGATIVIDPFLSEHELRVHEPPAFDTLPDRVDAVLATHGHLDHLDLDGLAAWISHGATLRALVVPTPHVTASRTALAGVDVVGVQPGDQLAAGTAQVTVVPAWHGVGVADGYTDGYHLDPAGTPHVGYVITMGATTIYHGGDTIASDEMRRALAPMEIDVALLPVNGRDAEREADGIVGNLTADEAVDLADAIGARCLVPCHFDAIRGNTVPVGDVDIAARRAGARVRVLPPALGRAVELPLAERS